MDVRPLRYVWGMPRIPRGLSGGGVAHVLNRGNARAQVFHTQSEYADFVGLLDDARLKHGVGILAFCLMPNHFHLVTQVEDGTSLSAMMQQWLTAHVRRHHKRRGTAGQGAIISSYQRLDQRQSHGSSTSRARTGVR